MLSRGMETFSLYQAGGRVDYNDGYNSQLGCAEVLVGTITASRNPSSTLFSITHVFPPTHGASTARYASLELVVRDPAGYLVAVATADVSSQVVNATIVPTITASAYYAHCNISSPGDWWCVSHPGYDACSLMILASSSSSSSSSTEQKTSSQSSHSSKSSKSSASSRSSSSSSSSSDSSSSYVKNLPTNLPSYVSTCRGMGAIANPAAGNEVGMAVAGHLDESEYPDDDTLIYKGGLTRTAANMGRIFCPDASKLFSTRYGMVSLTLRFPSLVSEGVYAPLVGKGSSANPDMVMFVANPGDCYVSPPGIYAALTPSGIEFTMWSLGQQNTIVDTTTNVDIDTDVILTFAWDYTRRITCGGFGNSMAILVDGVPTAYSSDPIYPSDFDELFQYAASDSDSSMETLEWAAAPFYVGDSMSGKNGLTGVVLRRLEIYKEPCFIAMDSEKDNTGIEPVGLSKGEVLLPFSVQGNRWVGVKVGDPDFKVAVKVMVNLLETGTKEIKNEVDMGKMEDDSYPETPNGLPPGIEEVRARQ